MTTLAIHPGALGDVILFGHLLTALGGARTLVAGGEKATLLAGLGRAERPLPFDTLPMHEAFDTGEPRGAPRRLPALLTGHGRLVSCFAGDAPAAQARLAALAGVESASFLPVHPPVEFSGHLLELWADLLGMEVTLRRTAWPVPPAWKAQADKALRDAGIVTRFAILHPGSGGKVKCWPLDRFAALATRLERAGWQVAWSLGPVELDTWPAGALEPLRERHAVFDRTPLPLLAGLLTRANVFIGNDSGVAHLAAAVGTPTVALFGPSNATHFRPVGPHVHVLAKPALADIHPSDVTDAAMAVALTVDSRRASMLPAPPP